MDDQAILEKYISHQLNATGERERLKEAIRQQLIESGWKPFVEGLSRDRVNQVGLEKVTLDGIYSAVHEDAQRNLPSTVRAELIVNIIQFMQKDAGKTDPPPFKRIKTEG